MARGVFLMKADCVLAGLDVAFEAFRQAAAVERARAHRPQLPVEIEAETLAQVDEALASGAETILVDNMPADRIREAVIRARGRARIEISGGVTLERMPELAATGADFVSV